jgi:hypothetical protein
MSRSQFVKNTLTAIQMQLPTAFPTQKSSSDLADSASVRGNSETNSSIDSPLRSKRSDSVTSWNSISRETILSSPISIATTHVTTPGHHPNGSTPSVQISTSGHDQKSPNVNVVYGRAWESDMENLLKVAAFWNSSFDPLLKT